MMKECISRCKRLVELYENDISQAQEAFQGELLHEYHKVVNDEKEEVQKMLRDLMSSFN